MTAAALPRTLEKDVQRAIYELLVQCDCKVLWLSQARETQQTPGLPDLLAFSRLRGMAFIEVKSPNGKQRAAQREFQEWCELTGITYILADRPDPVRDWLGRKGKA